MNKFLTYVMSVLIISMAAVIVGYFLIYDPSRTQLEELDQQIKTAESENQKHIKNKGEISKQEEIIEKTKQEIFQMLCKARGRKLETFLREIEDDADDAAIKLENIRIESVVTKELNSKIPLDFQISGPYFILYDFLQKLESTGKAKGKMDFSQSQISIASESKTDKLAKLDKLKSPKSKYNANVDKFPGLRVQMNGEIIIIDDTQLERYKTQAMSKCPDAPGGAPAGAPGAPAGGD